VTRSRRARALARAGPSPAAGNRLLVALVAIAIVVLVAVFAGVAIRSNAAKRSHQGQATAQAPLAEKAVLNGPAPNFSVSTTAGLFELDKTDKPVFLEVFTTWSPHSQREAPIVDRLYAKYKSQVDFIGVSGSDTAADGRSTASQADVLDWASRYKVQYPVAYDADQTVANLYLQGAFPTFAIVDTKKTITYLNTGELNYDALNAAIEKVLH
jgi:thiol-disulfide isomerase/thioredoxin